jgi:hypothetical protein
LNTLKQSLSVIVFSMDGMTDLKRELTRPGFDGETLERTVNIRFSSIKADCAELAFGGVIYV